MLIDAARRQTVELFSSMALLVELHGVMARAKFSAALAQRGLRAQALFEGYAALVELVTPAQVNPRVLSDPADDAVLACALAARADCVVSGDAHLLDLKHYQGISVIDATEAVRRIRRL